MESGTQKLALYFVILGASIWMALSSGDAFAQSCERPLCRAGERFTGETGVDRNGPYGVCRSGSGFFYRSHYLARCASGSTLDVVTGQCVLDACTGNVCGATAPLCDSDERYERGARDRMGAYGVCAHGPAPVTQARSHQIKRCGEGWTLDIAGGWCVRDCSTIMTYDPGPVVILERPDLKILDIWLRSAHGMETDFVEFGEPYYLCFTVGNVGGSASGVFRVAGGGLGVRTTPAQTHASLAPGQDRDGCLRYSTTPAPGNYKVGIKADSGNAVNESYEGNNEAVIKVAVVR